MKHPVYQIDSNLQAYSIRYSRHLAGLRQWLIVGRKGGGVLQILVLVDNRVVLHQRLSEDEVLLLVDFLLIRRRKSFPVQSVDEARVLLDALLQAALLQQYILVVVLAAQIRGHGQRIGDHFVNRDDIATANCLQDFVVQNVQCEFATADGVYVGASIGGSAISRTQA